MTLTHTEVIAELVELITELREEKATLIDNLKEMSKDLMRLDDTRARLEKAEAALDEKTRLLSVSEQYGKEKAAREEELMKQLNTQREELEQLRAQLDTKDALPHLSPLALRAARMVENSITAHGGPKAVAYVTKESRGDKLKKIEKRIKEAHDDLDTNDDPLLTSCLEDIVMLSALIHKST